MACRRAIALAVTAAAALGCNAILGLESEYVAGSTDSGPPLYPGPGKSGQSCEETDAQCADGGCCRGDLLPGGSYPMGNETQAADYDEQPEHPATVSSFRLDAFEVTVGRFRAFVAAYSVGWRPLTGAGAHPRISDSGWLADWDEKLPSDGDTLTENLKCIPFKHTWSDTPSASESFPLNCVSWYEALAFCIWDGGRLPTEAEWEYAATGGDENRTYPWGELDPDCAHVRMADCVESFEPDPVTTPFVNVGTRPQGVTRWGHYDMAGGLWEWTFDTYDDAWYHVHGSPCTDCANVTPGPRVDRGGCFYETDFNVFRTSFRGKDFPENRNDWLGFRCARDDP